MRGVLSTLVWHLSIKPNLRKLQKQLPEAKIYPAGSRYVCDPPPLTTDLDFLVYHNDKLDLELFGYRKHYNINYWGVDDGSFSSWRKGSINLIVTSSKEFATGFHTATHICRSHNIRHKYHRVLVHETFGRKETPLIHIEEYVQVGDILGIGFTRYNQIAAKINPLLEKLKGPYKDAIHAAYRAKHDLGKID